MPIGLAFVLDVAQIPSHSAGGGLSAGMDLADLLGGPASQPVANSIPSVPASVGLSSMSGQLPAMPTMVSPASGKL